MSAVLELDLERCSGCGLCVEDCPARLLSMDGDHPVLDPEKAFGCYGCQHCLAVCPGGAIALSGIDPDHGEPLAGPDPAALENLVKGRRSVRHYLPEPLDPALIRQLLEVAWHAPTGVNSRSVHFTVLDDRAKVARLRAQVMAGLRDLVERNALPERFAFYARFVELWEERGVDILFRDAPHLVVASAPASAPSPLPDCLIALTTFELLAQARGVGTLWDGLATWALGDLVPEARHALGIPADHLLGYVMLFGRPAVRYARTVQRTNPHIHLVP